MKMLFIGGTQDGEYIDVPDERVVWETSKYSKSLVRPYSKGAEPPLTAPAVETYRKVSISLCEMMVIDSLSVGEVIPRLMGCYRPEVKS